MSKLVIWSIAVISGVFLALMITFNSILSAHTSPYFSSLVAHGVGAVVALFVVQIYKGRRVINRTGKKTLDAAPWWTYLGGVPGAFIVALSAITVNSVIGLTGTLVLGIVGQLFFSLVVDSFGLFGFTKRSLKKKDIAVLTCIVSGSALVIIGRSA